DLELASKYFSLTVEGKTDPKWLVALEKAKEEEKIEEIISKIKTASPAGGWESYFGFEIKNEKGEIVYDIGLKQNPYSNLWKIERI
ncbi:MAG: hypothetical protein WCX99_03115, partial [Candidatus Paceibacterota bacterium]